MSFNYNEEEAHEDSVGVFFTAMIALVIALTMVLWYHVGYQAAKDDLPSCEEDEYLYPTDSSGHVAYEGPSKASPADYACFNFDSNLQEPQ